MGRKTPLEMRQSPRVMSGWVNMGQMFLKEDCAAEGVCGDLVD